MTTVLHGWSPRQWMHLRGCGKFFSSLGWSTHRVVAKIPHQSLAPSFRTHDEVWMSCTHWCQAHSVKQWYSIWDHSPTSSSALRLDSHWCDNRDRLHISLAPRLLASLCLVCIPEVFWGCSWEQGMHPERFHQHLCQDPSTLFTEVLGPFFPLRCQTSIDLLAESSCLDS